MIKDVGMTYAFNLHTPHKNFTKMTQSFALFCFSKSTSSQVNGEKENKIKEEEGAEGWKADLAKLARGKAKKQLS